jgi:hypothetical protein
MNHTERSHQEKIEVQNFNHVVVMMMTVQSWMICRLVALIGF